MLCCLLNICMKTSILCLAYILLLCNSCRVNGNLEGLYSYYHKAKKANPGLFVISNHPICELKNNDTARIYIINGLQLKKCVESLHEIIIYIWAPRCRGNSCYPLNLLQNKCDNRNI